MIDNVFESINNIIQLFVPGYVFLVISNYFLKNKTKAYELIVIDSVIISYVIQLFCGVINMFLHWPDISVNMFAVALAFVAALIYVRIKKSSWYKKLSVLWGKENGDRNIWMTIFDINRGSHIRFFTKFNSEDVMVEGDIKYYDICSDEQCDIAIDKYTITFKDKIEYKPYSDEQLFYVNTRNIHGLEVSFGKYKTELREKEVALSDERLAEK